MKVVSFNGTTRRAGNIHFINSINLYLLKGEMIISGSSYWNLRIGREKCYVINDTKDILTIKKIRKEYCLVF